MRDIIIVPTYDRPEYAFLCLKYLSQARGIDEKEVWLFQDNHGDVGIVSAMLPVVEFGRKLFPQQFIHVIMGGHSTYGNSANIITSLQCAYDAGAERIFLVEDDIMVAPDVFEWHEAVLEDSDAFVSCATALNKSAHFQINGPQAMDETLHDPSAYLKVCGPYSSHCAAFKRENLARLLRSVDEAMPSTWKQGYEQDILTQMILRSRFANSAWPYVPRAYNVGWRSYHINTGVQFTGTLEEKVAALESAIHDPVRLHNMSAGNQAVTALPAEWPVRTGPVHNVQRFR